MNRYDFLIMLTSFIVTMIAYAALNHTSQPQDASLVFVEFSAPIKVTK